MMYSHAAFLFHEKGGSVPTFLGGALSQHLPPMRLVSRATQEYAGACPFCGGDTRRSDRFHVWLHPAGRERYWCRRCDRKGRVAELGEQSSPRHSSAQQQPRSPYLCPAPKVAHVGAYRQLYELVASWAETNLHQPWNPEPLAYLYQRGFGTQTIREARLGFALRDPQALVEHLSRHTPSLLPYAEEAGVLARDDADALRTHWNLCGRIVIPYLYHGEVYDLRTRRFPGRGYTSLPGSYSGRGATVPFCWDVTQTSDVVLVTEGEFKALAVNAAYRAATLPYGAISHPGLNYFRSDWAVEMARRGVRVAILAYDARANRPRDEHGTVQLAPEEYWTVRHGLTLARAELQVFVLRLPLPPNVEKEDLDGFLLTHGPSVLSHLLHATTVPLHVYLSHLPRNLVIAAGFEHLLRDHT